MYKDTCDYCSTRSFNEKKDYLNHLSEEHSTDELSRIDIRKLNEFESEFIISTNTLLIGTILLLSVGIIMSGLALYVTTYSSDSPDDAPYHGLGEAHYHGTINVTIENQTIDFSRSKYQLQSRAFHFEGGDGTTWHVHARGVTLAYAMKTLDIHFEDSNLSFKEVKYKSYNLTVDGSTVEPENYVLQEGDHIKITAPPN